MRDSYIDLDDNVDREIRFYYSVVWNENPSYVLLPAQSAPPSRIPASFAGPLTPRHAG